MPEEVTNSELARALVRIEAKLDKIFDDHEVRLRRVEKMQWLTIGFSAAGAVSGLSAFLSALVG